jgi:hypothetical protein
MHCFIFSNILQKSNYTKKKVSVYKIRQIYFKVEKELMYETKSKQIKKKKNYLFHF